MKKFNERCYEILRKVPKGKVTTYKALAHALNTKAYRAVGTAMNKNPYSHVRSGRVGGLLIAKQSNNLVPCHRVIKSNGEVGGFASGTKNKIKILKKEGIEIKKGKIDLEKFLFKFNK